MTKLIYRGIEFDTAANNANQNAKAAKTDLFYRGYKNDGQNSPAAAPGKPARRPELTYRGYRIL